MELGKPFVRDLQLDAPGRIRFEEIDVLPGDHPRRDLVQQGAQRKRRDETFGEPADGASGPDVHGHDGERDMAVERRRIELDVVDADDLAAVHIDDLLIEEVALQQQLAVGRDVRLPVRPLLH